MIVEPPASRSQSHRCSSCTRHCYSLTCEPCAWRYSLKISRRILAHDPRRLVAITLQTNLTEVGEFQRGSVAVRNLIDHRRRENRWWRDLGLWGWLRADGQIRGIVSLGAVMEREFCGAFANRWPVSVRAITPADLRHVIFWEALRPGVIVDTGPQHGRYQRIKITVEPQRAREATPGLLIPTWSCQRDADNPLPVIV